MVEKAGIRTEGSAQCLCALHWRKERNGDREVDAGWGWGGGRAPVWRAKTPVVPFLPGAPDLPCTCI